MSKKKSESTLRMETRAQNIAMRQTQPVDKIGFWTAKIKDEARAAHSKGRNTVFLNNRKFKLSVNKNRDYLLVVPADGATVPMACLDRRTYN